MSEKEEKVIPAARRGYPKVDSSGQLSGIADVYVKLGIMQNGSERHEAELAEVKKIIESVHAQQKKSTWQAVGVVGSLFAAIALVVGYVGNVSLSNLKENFDNRAADIVERSEALDEALTTIATKSGEYADSIEKIASVVDQSRDSFNLRLVELDTTLESLQDGMASTIERFSDVDARLTDTIEGLKLEVASLAGAVRAVDPSLGKSSKGQSSFRTKEDLMTALSAAMRAGDISTIVEALDAAQSLIDDLPTDDLAVLATAAGWVGKNDLSIFISRKGVQRLETTDEGNIQKDLLLSAFYARIGDALGEEGKVDEALSTYDECLSSLPTSEQCLNNKAFYLMKLELYDEACELIRRAAEGESRLKDRAAIQNNLSLCYFEAGVRADAKGDTSASLSYFAKMKASSDANIEIAEQVEGDGGESLGNALIVASVAHSAIGNFGEAQGLLDRAVATHAYARGLTSDGQDAKDIFDAFVGSRVIK